MQPTRRCPSARGRRSRADRAHRVVDAVDARECLGEHVVDVPLQLEKVDRLDELDRLLEQRQCLVVLAAVREDSRPCRPPPGLRVEIVRSRYRSAFRGELERLIVTAPMEQDVGEDRVHGRPDADVADLDQHVVPAAKHLLRAIEISTDELADSDVRRIEALGQSEIELLDKDPCVGSSTT